MKHQKQEHLELRSEKMRRIIGDIPQSLVWTGLIVIACSILVLIFCLLLFKQHLFGAE